MESLEQTQKRIEKEKANYALREKAWDACNADEKMEKLKIVFTDTKNITNNHQFTHNLLVERVKKLESHTHSPNGEIMVPLVDKDNRGGLNPGVSTGMANSNKSILD